MRFRSPCLRHPSGNVRDRRRPFAAELAPLTPTAPCVLPRTGEGAPRRRLPLQPACQPRSGSLPRAHLCTAARPSPCGRDGGLVGRDTTWMAPFELMRSIGIGWQELCPAYHGSRPCALLGRKLPGVERLTGKEMTLVSRLISRTRQSAPAGCYPDRGTPGCTCQRRRRGL